MSKLLNWPGCVVSAPRRVLSEMNRKGFDFVTWTNNSVGLRFVAKKSYVEKEAHNKFAMRSSDHIEIGEDEVLEVGIAHSADEMLLEMQINNVEEIKIQEGFGGTTTIKMHDLDSMKRAKEFSQQD